jgi:hypothetical protein
MITAKIIIYISSGVWLLPVFRQYKGNYFYYFLILALSDPLNIFFGSVLGILQGGHIHSVLSILIFYSIGTTGQNFLKNWIFHLIFILCFLYVLFFMETQPQLVLVIHFLVLYKFIKNAIIHLHNTNLLNFFYLILIFYEITLIVNLIVLIGRTDTGYILFYITASFQILIALFFAIFREDSSLLSVRVRAAP